MANRKEEQMTFTQFREQLQSIVDQYHLDEILTYEEKVAFANRVVQRVKEQLANQRGIA